MGGRNFIVFIPLSSISKSHVWCTNTLRSISWTHIISSSQYDIAQFNFVIFWSLQTCATYGVFLIYRGFPKNNLLPVLEPSPFLKTGPHWVFTNKFVIWLRTLPKINFISAFLSSMFPSISYSFSIASSKVVILEAFIADLHWLASNY